MEGKFLNSTAKKDDSTAPKLVEKQQSPGDGRQILGLILTGRRRCEPTRSSLRPHKVSSERSRLERRPLSL